MLLSTEIASLARRVGEKEAIRITRDGERLEILYK